MTGQTPAETLRAAAERLREHVAYLSLHDVRGPWTVHSGPSGYPQEINNVGVPILIANTFTDPKAPPVEANYIALMHPGVGTALADWLEAASLDHDMGRDHDGCDRQICASAAALAVARTILGGQL